MSDILLTGGSGQLGLELCKNLKCYTPSHNEFDITNINQMRDYISNKNISKIIHCAAFISPPKIDQDPKKAIETNIIGTSNLTTICIEKNIYLIYISTDYVFNSEKGNYSEEDPVYPVNKYAWSKLGGECAVRMHNNSLIIRTSFTPKEFPYPKAFVDQYTTRETVDVIAKKIIYLANLNLCGTIHIGGIKQSVKNYAISIGKTDVQDLKSCDVNFSIPKDTSLLTKKFDSLKLL